MGRPRREIYSGQVYEICMRTELGLPFVCTNYMKIKPLEDWIGDDPAISYVAIRADEANRMSEEP